MHIEVADLQRRLVEQVEPMVVAPFASTPNMISRYLAFSPSTNFMFGN